LPSSRRKTAEFEGFHRRRQTRLCSRMRGDHSLGREGDDTERTALGLPLIDSPGPRQSAGCPTRNRSAKNGCERKQFLLVCGRVIAESRCQVPEFGANHSSDAVVRSASLSRITQFLCIGPAGLLASRCDHRGRRVIRDGRAGPNPPWSKSREKYSAQAINWRSTRNPSPQACRRQLLQREPLAKRSQFT
jgi:hypothetical protein